MSRRSKSNSSSHLAVYIIIGVAAIAALIIGKIILDKRSQHFSNLSELSITDIKNNATSLSGNTYRITGKISEKLKWTPDRGQIISLSIDQSEQGKGTIPILVPAAIDKVNLERGHTYTFKVNINREGLPVAQDVKAQ